MPEPRQAYADRVALVEDVEGDVGVEVPRCLGFALAEAVALAHDGRVEINETPTGTIATLVLSRVPQPLSTRLSTASRHSDT